MEERGQTAVGVGGYLLVVLGIITLVVGVGGLFNVGPLERDKLTLDEVKTAYPAILTEPVPTTATAVVALVNATQENVEAQVSIVTTVVAILLILLGGVLAVLARVLSRVTGALRI